MQSCPTKLVLVSSNRLAHEKSPYLLQHAHNPVDWYPWGQAALDKARQEDKPIFLSIGYSTCHWCHVMEHESFENEDIARVLNEHFVPVKVDREERPDLDRVYMLFVQASTGSGGWPMSVWLTPEGKPFFGGTYFPPDTRYGRPGFGAILKRLAQAWREDRAKIEESGSHVLEQLLQYSQQNAGGRGQVGQNVIVLFKLWHGMAAFYIVTMAFLGLHLGHGVWSFFQTMGLNHPAWNALRWPLAILTAVGIAGGFALIPLAIAMGWF
jgi:uncharacterized protein YyaL (SSP411 family)